MPSLDEDFATLQSRIIAPGSMVSSRTDPFYYFVYPPDQALAVKRHLPVWVGRLRQDGLEPEVVSLSDLMWQAVEAIGHWEEWLLLEPDFAEEQVNEAVHNALAGDALVNRVAEHVSGQVPRKVVLLTDAELLHPYFRVRLLESALHDRIKIPTILFYPGTRSGQFGLKFLGFYPADANYRATLIGGLP